MIYLLQGVTQSVWLSLRESAPIGSTNSFLFQLTNDISGEVKSFRPTDLQPSNKWSRFNFRVDAPENLNSGILDIAPGMWSLKVTDGVTTLETGKVVVQENKTWNTLTRPAKNKVVLRR